MVYSVDFDAIKFFYQFDYLTSWVTIADCAINIPG